MLRVCNSCDFSSVAAVMSGAAENHRQLIELLHSLQGYQHAFPGIRGRQNALNLGAVQNRQDRQPAEVVVRLPDGWSGTRDYTVDRTGCSGTATPSHQTRSRYN